MKSSVLIWVLVVLDVNGQLRLEAEDDSLAAGRSGIATNTTQASFAYFLSYQP